MTCLQLPSKKKQMANCQVRHYVCTAEALHLGYTYAQGKQSFLKEAALQQPSDPVDRCIDACGLFRSGNHF